MSFKNRSKTPSARGRFSKNYFQTLEIGIPLHRSRWSKNRGRSGGWGEISEIRKKAYAGLVRSTLEYGAVVWDPFLEKDILKLEKINRKAARFIKGDFKTRTPGCVTEMMCDLDLPTLQKRRKEKRLSFL